ncbi:MAG: hypothetical protein D6736_10225, partial [Nitrospinota bacterium]
RRALEAACRAQIELGSWFETPLHPIPLHAHARVGYRLGSCPVSEATAAQVINLPLHERVTSDDAERIVRFLLSHSAPTSVRVGG